jgi:hypothetical protein
LARLLHQKPAVTELNCYMNQLGDAGMVLLGPAVKDCK